VDFRCVALKIEDMKIRTLLIAISIFVFALNISAQEMGTITDSRDGKIYKTVKIGTQIMMAENLAFKPTTGKYWAYDNDEKNVKNYGYLYDWETAKKVCPAGWHLPSKKEYDILIKSAESNSEGKFDYLIKYGDSGFSSADCGYREVDGTFLGFDIDAFYWSCTPYLNDKAWYLSMTRDDDTAKMSFANKASGFSVRCFKD